ncbi:hypothetical protein OFC05_28950, partial [Escherichia coli]|nr:hypothetical protein [Escherichia coli]
MPLEIKIATPSRPIDWGINQDVRPLGIMLRSARLRAVEPWPALPIGESSVAAGSRNVAWLGAGWSTPAEADGVWSKGERA